MARRIRATTATIGMSDKVAFQWIGRVRRYVGMPATDDPVRVRMAQETSAEIGALQDEMIAAGATPAEIVAAVGGLLHERGPAWARREADALFAGGGARAAD